MMIIFAPNLYLCAYHPRAAYYKKQQEANQKLQDHIQAVGGGIVAGAIVASNSGLMTEPWYSPNGEKIELPFTPPHPFVIALFWSVFCSVGAWLLAERFIKKSPSKSKSDSE